MSNALAIAGVTAVLQYFLNVVYNKPTSVLGSVSVSAVAPDIIQANMGGGSAAALQVNLFLHQVTPNVAWRNVDLPSLDSGGATPLQNPPLALDLHYLLTAYASDDSQAEALLSTAIFLLHENPILPRNQIRAALAGLPSTYPAAFAKALAASGLADQIEMIKITPETLGREEMAWLWTALKADYRPTFPFQVSVVLIEPQLAISMALPVLSQNISVQAGPPAQLFELQLSPNKTSVGAGDSVTISGQSLGGTSNVLLVNPRLGIDFPPFPPAQVTDGFVTFKVPTSPSSLPAGVYNLSLQSTDPTGTVTQTTNAIPIAIAPAILGTPTTTTAGSTTTVSVTCLPDALPNQSISLVLASTAAPAQTFEAQTNSLSFQFPKLSGKYLVRLRVDGVESPLQIDWTKTPPVFTGPFLTV